MQITEIKENKKQYLELLLLADEQENMIDRYLEKGTMYVLDDNGIKCECVVTDEGNGILELKNIAAVPAYQKKGLASFFSYFSLQINHVYKLNSTFIDRMVIVISKEILNTMGTDKSTFFVKRDSKRTVTGTHL